MFKLGDRTIDTESPAIIIAEISANHSQDYSIAKKTITAIKEAGADAVKMQTYTPDTITLNCKSDIFYINSDSPWKGKYLYELYQEAYTPWEWQPKLKDYTESLGLFFFSSPFDKSAVDFLEEMDVPAYKVASFEITDIPLIEYIARKQKPIILATGIATEEDIRFAVETCRNVGNNQIVVLKCTSAYPAPFDDINLKTIPDIAQRFQVIPGLSDHTLGHSAALGAVTLGAKFIEKHFILDRKLGGPDASFSMEPAEFKLMIQSIRELEKALGSVSYELTDTMKKGRDFSRSLFAVRDIALGEQFTDENIRSIRPGFGLPPRFLPEIIGLTAKHEITLGTPLTWDMINKNPFCNGNGR